MKRLLAIALVLLLALFTFTACGGGSGSGNSGGGSAATTTEDSDSDSDSKESSDNSSADAGYGADVILASQLITLEDATRLLGEEAKCDKKDAKSSSFLHTVYCAIDNEMYMIQIQFYQDALMDDIQKQALGGAKGFGETIRKQVEDPETTVQIDGDWDWACIERASMYIGYNDYFIILTRSGRPAGSNFSVEEADEWGVGFLTEIGEHVLGRLKALT